MQQQNLHVNNSFIFVIFNKAENISYYTASNRRMTANNLTRKDVEGRICSLVWSTTPEPVAWSAMLPLNL